MLAGDSHEAQRETLLAVNGQGIYFHFGRKKKSVILSGVNIAVNQGSIYSLLGPSGCGKTTLLKCIIGQHKPQTGSIKVYGRRPGSKESCIPGRGVGYMPQDLALYMDMNTEETLTYFGSLYGMNMRNINERITFLVDLFELPDKRKQIQYLSGGQQRRVSFAIALIHKPPLVILDEPTVGVDPLLRKVIWDHLVALAKDEHVTVMITTHYTEEARQAHMVGFMRKGQILVERNPEYLIKRCGGRTLEDVFLKLCQKNRNEVEDLEPNNDELTSDMNVSLKSLDTNGAIREEKVSDETCAIATKPLKRSDGSFDQRNDIVANTTVSSPLSPFRTECYPENFSATSSLMRFYSLTRKNFLRFKRNIPVTLFTIGICVTQVTLLFLCCIFDPFYLQMATVNEEDGGLNKFGEKFLLSVSDSTFSKKPFDNFTLAYESLRKGESWAVLRINSEYSDCLADRVLKGVDASNETVLCSSIKIILDTSNQVIATTIRKSVLTSYQTFIKDVLISLDKNPLSGTTPVHFEEYNNGESSATFIEFLNSGLLLIIAYVISLGLSTMSTLAERKYGLMGRANIAGATTAEFLLADVFTLVVILFLQVVSMLLVTAFVFNIQSKGSIFWVTAAVMLTGMCGISYGCLLSALTDDENASILMGSGTFFPILFLSAAFWPLDAMPQYLRYFSNCLPLTRIIDSARSIMIRGWNITDNHIWDGYLICSFWVIVQMTLSIILLKIRK